MPSVQCDPPPIPLAPGHRRRIFFGLADTSNQDSFGLGYEEIDENGVTVSQHAVSSFDPSVTTICLPLDQVRLFMRHGNSSIWGLSFTISISTRLALV